MTPHPTDHAPEAAMTARLLRGFGASGWQIAHHETLSYWSAERTSADGQHIRYLTAHSATELAGLIEAAKTDEP